MMALVSPYQYVWASIEGPLANQLEVSLSALGFVFTVYVVVMALVQFPAGWWRDRYGPRAVIVVAGLLAGVGYYALSFVTAVWHVYVAYFLGAVGVGMVYTVSVNTAVKWFPDKRGLTTGIGTMAFAAGSAAFVPYIRIAVADGTLANALSNMGMLIGIGIIVGAVALNDPPKEFNKQAYGQCSSTDQPSTNAEGDSLSERDSDGTTTASDGGVRSYTWQQMIRTKQFALMYFMFFAVSAAGLMITARVVLYAEQAELTATAVTVAATLLPIASAGGRLVVGGVSDYYSREWVAAVSFTVCGLATMAIVLFAGVESGIGYILMVTIAVFFWSSQFSLFPSLVGDYYGSKHSSTNYSIVYSGKMWGGVFGGGVVGWLVGVLGWDVTFLLGGILALAAGIVGFFLKPPR
ncbi:MFS transporter [Natronolimnohabitans innermongolicus]|uniref:Major facilitator superfamily protein n=1 Tax=Natronolimnohabitans innermongolicus JCM 12255 TaxID=1227499 RepID=L9WL15_9EURY|nr:major facilitator superfamily protein [Natronolimnohabitans innermongolicus JCM 12255]